MTEIVAVVEIAVVTLVWAIENISLKRRRKP